MANPHLSSVLAEFEASVHRTKDRLVAIPAAVQRSLRLKRWRNNHLVLFSIRKAGRGRWHHIWAKLTFDNEFGLSSGFTAVGPGDAVEVRIRRIVEDQAFEPGAAADGNGGSLLLDLATDAGEDERTDGSERVDDYLYGDDAA